MPRAHHYNVGTNPACLLLSQTYTAERFSSLKKISSALRGRNARQRTNGRPAS
jgi:hypothetical protein